MADTEWSKQDKRIARRAFDHAYQLECSALIREIQRRANDVGTPDELWQLHDILTRRREDIAEKYDFRSSTLIFVLARLIGDGWLTEAELAGLSELRVEQIRFLTRGRE